MNTALKSKFDQFDELIIFTQVMDEDYEWAFDDLDEDLSDASDEKTVLD